MDLADLCWSPTGTHIIVWDSYLTYKLMIYEPSHGPTHLASKF